MKCWNSEVAQFEGIQFATMRQFSDFLKKTCRFILVAQGRNPSPGEE
jgi:hypothetical protein